MKNHSNVVLLTLGCRSNTAETQELARQLQRYGIASTFEIDKDTPPGAVYVVNTCAVTATAERKSRHLISTIATRDHESKIIIMGCASENIPTQFTSPNIIKIFGNDKMQVAEFISQLVGATCSIPLAASSRKQYFLKVQDGCDNACSFCIVSSLRGPSTSRPVADILREVNSLINTPQQLTITGINLSQYDSLGKTLIDLCEKIDTLNIPFRLSSLYIDAITGEFITRLSNLKNFLPHFHLSIQSASNNVLRSMGRRYSQADIRGAISLIRTTTYSGMSHIPSQDVRITADIIVGFPTETEVDFEETKVFLEKIQLDDLHIFPYSPRPGTRAAEMPQLKNSIVTKRAKILKSVIINS